MTVLKHGAVSCLEESNMKHGLNSEFLAYSGCVQVVKKYTKGLATDVQSNKYLKLNQRTRELIKFEMLNTRQAQQRPEMATEAPTWHACKHKGHKLHQRHIRTKG